VTCIARDDAGLADTCGFNVTVAQPVPLDIRPGTCPNLFNMREQGVIPVAILGTSGLDVSQIDIGSIRLEGVHPAKVTFEDVGAPFSPFTGKSSCLDCNSARRDGRRDLSLKFNSSDLAKALVNVTEGECRVVHLTASLTGGCPVVGEDVVRIHVPGGLQIADEPAIGDAPPIPAACVLHANSPNPFARTTSIRYDLAGSGRVRLAVFDIAGREVRLITEGVEDVGSHAVTWDGRDENGLPLSNGLYLTRLTFEPREGGEQPLRLLQKMILSR
jgi:hypothetical protein